MLVLFLVIVVYVSTVCWFWNGHNQLGSKGHTCFANTTCRTGLRCFKSEGLNPDGVCVKP